MTWFRAKTHYIYNEISKWTKRNGDQLQVWAVIVLSILILSFLLLVK